MKRQPGKLSRRLRAVHDGDLLATALSAKITELDLSLREAAAQIRCSPATLSRLLRGSSIEHQPDTPTLLAAVSWLGKELGDFAAARRPTSSSLMDVKLHLQALGGFTKADVHVVMALIRALQEVKRAPRSRR